MKLYEINERAAAIIAALEPDPDTGEIVANEEELLNELETLTDNKNDILEWIAKEQLNARAEADAAQIEIDRLRKKKDRATTRAERLLAILERECNGKKTNLGVATLSYRKSKSVVIDDESAVVDWLKCNTGGVAEGAYRYELKINKVILKRAIDEAAEQGTAVDGAHIEERVSASLR